MPLFFGVLLVIVGLIICSASHELNECQILGYISMAIGALLFCYWIVG